MGDVLKDAMTWLGQQPDTLFIGQGVGPCGGTKMSASFEDVPESKRIEFPVAEDFQMGVSIGLSLEGFVPVSVYPRWNFLLLAANQLVNHLDALPLFSDYRPRVIIRTAVGSRSPLDPGPQHDGDFTEAVAKMLRTVKVMRLKPQTDPVAAYQWAYEQSGGTLTVEP